MVIIMDSGTGKIEESRATFSDFGQFGDEVLNAGWLPRLETLSAQEADGVGCRQAAHAPAVADADAFMRSLYCSQE